MDFVQEQEVKELANSKLFVARMQKENPEHAMYYCSTHGQYVGFKAFKPCKLC